MEFQLIRLLVIIWLIGSIESRLVKRSYSDQSVRGYLTEVCLSYTVKSFNFYPVLCKHIALCCFDFLFNCSACVGGMKCVKRNFNKCFVANVPFIRIADHLDATTMHIARWQTPDTFGLNRVGIGFLDQSTPIVYNRWWKTVDSIRSKCVGHFKTQTNRHIFSLKKDKKINQSVKHIH